jgi:hypothetical protein
MLILDSVDVLANAVLRALETLHATVETDHGLAVLHLHESIAHDGDDSCSLGADESRLDIQDERIHEAVLDSIIGEVLPIEAYVNIQGLWCGILWNGALNHSRAQHGSRLQDVVSPLVLEPNFDFGAVAVGTNEVIACDF